MSEPSKATAENRTPASERGEVKKLSSDELSKSRFGLLARYPGPELFADEDPETGKNNPH